MVKVIDAKLKIETESFGKIYNVAENVGVYRVISYK